MKRRATFLILGALCFLGGIGVLLSAHEHPTPDPAHGVVRPVDEHGKIVYVSELDQMKLTGWVFGPLAGLLLIASSGLKKR